IKDALDRTKQLRFRDQVNKRKFSTFAGLTAGLAVALVISLYISSLFFPIGTVKLLAFKPPNVDAFELKVTPGDITVARGSDVTIQAVAMGFDPQRAEVDRKSTRLNSSHVSISYAVFCLKKKK